MLREFECVMRLMNREPSSRSAKFLVCGQLLPPCSLHKSLTHPTRWNFPTGDAGTFSRSLDHTCAARCQVPATVPNIISPISNNIPMPQNPTPCYVQLAYILDIHVSRCCTSSFHVGESELHEPAELNLPALCIVLTS